MPAPPPAPLNPLGAAPRQGAPSRLTRRKGRRLAAPGTAGGGTAVGGAAGGGGDRWGGPLGARTAAGGPLGGTAGGGGARRGRGGAHFRAGEGRAGACAGRATPGRSRDSGEPPPLPPAFPGAVPAAPGRGVSPRDRDVAACGRAIGPRPCGALWRGAGHWARGRVAGARGRGLRQVFLPERRPAACGAGTGRVGTPGRGGRLPGSGTGPRGCGRVGPGRPATHARPRRRLLCPVSCERVSSSVVSRDTQEEDVPFGCVETEWNLT